jgi:hypothetical protein
VTSEETYESRAAAVEAAIAESARGDEVIIHQDDCGWDEVGCTCEPHVVVVGEWS